MQIFFSFYQLKRKQKSNSQVHSLFQKGALIKVVDDDSAYGVADLCPWPELGDLSLEQEISQRGVLFQRTLELAQEDLRARRQQKALISSRSVRNHILVTDFESFVFQDPEFIYKIKGTKDYKKLAAWLNKNQNSFALIRLDFNSCLTEIDYRDFLKMLEPTVVKKIDMVEDPFPFHLGAWVELQKKTRLAIDFEKGEWPVQVVKPARQNPVPQTPYLTSNMDHPVGVAHGFRFAQMHPLATHGFLTLDVYEENNYSKAFHQNKNELIYHSDGFGIGFTSLLAKENWIPDIPWANTFDTILLFNSQVSPTEMTHLFEIKKFFAKDHPKDHILMASSGSTQQPGDLKVFAFHKTAFLNSAERVVRHFNLTSAMNWGCVLPHFHVGGLGVLARAYVVNSKIFCSTWSEFSVDWLVENDIQLLSLVPTQVFDIVNRKLKAPQSLKYVFIGGAALDPQTETAARELGWPLVLTYGMTETASMIAQKNADGLYKTFSGVELVERDGHFFVHTNSTAFAQINLIGGKISQKFFSDVELPDLIEKNSDGCFALLGRWDDQIKVNGELVNLSRLKSLLPAEFAQNLEVIATAHERKGHSLVLVGEQIPTSQLRQIALELNQSVKKFEKIEFIATLDRFPRSALNKIKVAELKNLIEARTTYERL